MQVFPDHCNIYVKTKLHATLVYLFDFYLFVGLAEITSFQPYTMSGQPLPENATMLKNTTVILRCQVSESTGAYTIVLDARGPDGASIEHVSDL